MRNQRDYFRTKTCYKLYLYAKSLAEQVNDCISRGYLVFDVVDDDLIDLGKFMFEGIHGDPVIAQLSKDGSSRFVWLDKTHDKHGKIWICCMMTKKEIRALFENIRIVHPASIERINFKK